ncbi:MAG TPA: AzlC family ABC transporter permease [Acidimicrobiales bacterium]|nr:AzlC family ABC transporter permease [Acidimicrobiales bacterium]
MTADADKTEEGADRDSGSIPVLRDALAVGLTTGAYGLSFGAVATTAGLSVLQACVLSLAMFTGASQFALVGVVGAGGSAVAGAATAVLVSSRNAFYGLRLSALLGLSRWRRPLAAQIVIDESTAMAIGRDDPGSGRLAFWATGASVFIFWNLATLAGAVGARSLSDPRALGLDAAAPAAFVALIAPSLKGRRAWASAVLAAAVALALVPSTPAGVPVLAAAAVAVAVGVAPRLRR